MKYIYLLIILSLLYCNTFAQPPVKILQATKTTVAPKIDGVLDDEIWKTTPIATDFVELNPVAGRHEKPEERTEVRILYDNDAIYVAARMYETGPDKIARELATRDNVGNADFIGIVLDTYLDGINASGFYVTAAGSQYDAKYAPSPNGNNEDGSWNAVWDSKVKIDDKGWTAEFRIPYSALRFSKKDVQTWGLNLTRRRQKFQQQLFWNPLDPKKNGFINQEGQLTGIEKLTPPVRLAFYPYFSTYVNHYPYNTRGVSNTTSSVNGGMDIKYGINQSFTVDMTLIPDFGQVQSDNQVLNLTPVEVKYNENRPFFTEGTELFNKGNLFYSRRIGGPPIDRYGINLNAHEQIIKNPTESRLLNATKFSGRTGSGLGIGVFNAVQQAGEATIQDTINGNTRLVPTSPTTNYNILVLDQNLKNNSSVTLINTNVDRFGSNYNADVGGFAFNLNNKTNSYGLTGYGFMSNLIYPDKTDTKGYSYEISAAKNQGSITWNLTEDFVSPNYNSNDLGFLNNPNYFDHSAYIQYANYKPSKHITQWSAWSNIYYSRRYAPSDFQTADLAVGGNVTFKSFWQFGTNYHYQPAGNDFYGPEIRGARYNNPSSYRGNWFGNSPRSGAFNWGFFVQIVPVNNGQGSFTNVDELFYNYRFNNHFAINEDVMYNPQRNVYGFFTVDGSNRSVYSLYNRNTVENTLSLKYTFTAIMGINLRVRHYWSVRNNLSFYNLKADGNLTPRVPSEFNATNDEAFNTFNVDMVYVWQFSPGSELSIAYKNSSLTDTNQGQYGYYHNLQGTFNSPQNNNFSVKVLYYVDYQNLRKHHTKS
jgi:hypothetical protein